MSAEGDLWCKWAAFLQHWGLEQIAASLLEAGASLTFIGAQLLYISEPLFRHTPWQQSVAALGRLLDEPEDLRRFVGLLREPQGE